MAVSVADGDPYVAKYKITETNVKNRITLTDAAGRAGHQGNSRVEIDEKRVV
ncbi:hypothetical protein LGN17_10355 [Burkholderia sp. AU30280]|uniref:hypothetical protein n=1 Tax=Burkholderia sp. AU30280 TaxID=2879628 RepID=UPI001CF379C4|nr:hypothetical protein [Burkholderia sp. AU30280]MCA8272914.1 hypothetical protein [Burkholderia sp. AU30280]